MSKIIIIMLFSVCCLDAREKVYVINYSWHTGYLIEVNPKTILLIPALEYFQKYDFVDIGWGDIDFYRSDDAFDIQLALKAALIPTKSTVRIEGTNLPISRQKEYANFLIQYEFDEDEFLLLADFINKSITYENSYPEVLEIKAEGAVIFFASPIKYHIFNTCNTWIARGLQKSICDKNASSVLHSAYLYRKFSSCGVVIKPL